MPTWLITADLRVHLELPTAGATETPLDTRLEDALNAAMELVDSRTSTSWDDAVELPALIREAGLLQASRLFKRQSAPFGIATVGTVDGGQGMRLSARIDPDVELLLADWAEYASL